MGAGERDGAGKWEGAGEPGRRATKKGAPYGTP